MPNVEARANRKVSCRYLKPDLGGYFDYSYRYRRFVLLD
jgi:hypothetical protein